MYAGRKIQKRETLPRTSSLGLALVACEGEPTSPGRVGATPAQERNVASGLGAERPREFDRVLTVILRSSIPGPLRYMRRDKRPPRLCPRARRRVRNSPRNPGEEPPSVWGARAPWAYVRSLSQSDGGVTERVAEGLATDHSGRPDYDQSLLGHGHASARSSTQSTYNRRSENSHVPSIFTNVSR